MVKTNEFLGAKIEKSGATLKGVSSLITQSFEVEAMTRVSSSTLKVNLSSIGKGFASDCSVNDGNGWNSDVHFDVSLVAHTRDNGGLYGTETSSSPIDICNWFELKNYLNGILETYKTASGGKICHTVYGSMHVHNTLSYTYARNEDGYRVRVNAIKLDAKMVYHNVARFILKFMPVMKWLVMTDYYGARGMRGSSYGDKFDNDALFSWWSNYEGSIADDSTYRLTSFDRRSCFRVMETESIHYENRLADCTFNTTHIGMWLAVNRAITLLGIDFARNGYMFNLTNEEVDNSRNIMHSYRNGFNNVDKNKVKNLYQEFLGYIAKYLKISCSLEAIDVMDKLISFPIPQYLVDNSVREDYWNLELIDKVFNTRNRASDTALRDKFLHGVKTMSIPYADSLNEFLENTANYLGVEVKKVKSLYQMFKREHVEIEFLVNRLVYLGD